MSILLRSSSCTFRTHGPQLCQSLPYLVKRKLTTVNASSRIPIVEVRNLDVFQLGDTKREDVLLENVTWTVNPDELWSVVGPAAARNHLFQALLGRRRVIPSPNHGLFPFLSTGPASSTIPEDHVLYVSFAQTQPRIVGGDGSFTDYTARYGAAFTIEDQVTLRESLMQTLSDQPPPRPPTEFDNPNENAVPLTWPERVKDIDTLAHKLNLTRQLNVPFVALSHGQSRRARILRYLLKRPKLLLLDDPFSGLDVEQAPRLAELLQALHAANEPRIVLGLRSLHDVSQWLGKNKRHHCLQIEGKAVKLVTVGGTSQGLDVTEVNKNDPAFNVKDSSQAPEVVSLKNVNVRYGDRRVLRSINWTIREGDKWHLVGANGSGKTTLCSMIRGEHPQSFTQTSSTSHFNLFGKPRRQTPTVTLQKLIGISSPEIFAAFPRRTGPGSLTVGDAIATGIDGTFAYRQRNDQEMETVRQLIDRLGKGKTVQERRKWANQTFAEVSPGEQSLVLFMRAVVRSPPLLILDEAFIGMDQETFERVRDYLLKEGQRQAILVISHEDFHIKGFKKYALRDGEGQVVSQ